MRRYGPLLATLATATLALVPPAGEARPSAGPGCARAGSVGFSIGGPLVSLRVDDPKKQVKRATVTIRVTSRSTHARRAGKVAAGARFTVPASQTFVLRLAGYADGAVPMAGDPVRVSGTIARRRARCLPAGAGTAARYGAIDVRTVTVSDR